jgi:hypothetical protein
MSPTNRNTIASALSSVLSGIDGTGLYTYDLSGTGQVEQLDLDGPPVSRVRPYVAYHLGPRQDIRGGQGADLSSYGQTLTVDVVGVVTGGASRHHPRAPCLPEPRRSTGARPHGLNRGGYRARGRRTTAGRVCRDDR